jgi:hypothetical protein
MQSMIRIYEHNRKMIEKFLVSSLHKQHVNKLGKSDKQEVERLFNTLKSLELVYVTDKKYVQITPNYYRNKTDPTHVGEDKSSLLELEGLSETNNISLPYISGITGKLVVTVMIIGNEQIRFFDFSVKSLLKELGLIESHVVFDTFSRLSYAVIGGGLIFIALFALGFGFYEFFKNIVTVSSGYNLSHIFNSVIAFTLALAFFDLGKAIVKHEVFAKSESLEVFDASSFLTFVASIMIALMIEALLAVFKISINGYEKMPYAAMLIASLALLMFVFAWFVKISGIWSRSRNRTKE